MQRVSSSEQIWRNVALHHMLTSSNTSSSSNASSSEKAVSSGSGLRREIYTMMYFCLQTQGCAIWRFLIVDDKNAKKKSKTNMTRDKIVKNKNRDMIFLPLQTQLNWSRVDYCDAFISCLDFHSDGTHPFTEDPLVSKWCNSEFIQICSDEEKTNLHLGWPFFVVGWTISLKGQLTPKWYFCRLTRMAWLLLRNTKEEILGNRIK